MTICIVRKMNLKTETQELNDADDLSELPKNLIGHVKNYRKFVKY